MTFGFGDVCTRANGRGEKGGDEAAEGKTVPQAISQLSHHSLPSRLKGRRRNHTRGLRGRIRQMAGEEEEVGGGRGGRVFSCCSRRGTGSSGHEREN